MLAATKASRHHNPGAFEIQTFAFQHNSRPYHQNIVQLATYLLRFVRSVYNDCTTRSVAHLR